MLPFVNMILKAWVLHKKTEAKKLPMLKKTFEMQVLQVAGAALVAVDEEMEQEILQEVMIERLSD